MSEHPERAEPIGLSKNLPLLLAILLVTVSVLGGGLLPRSFHVVLGVSSALLVASWILWPAGDSSAASGGSNGGRTQRPSRVLSALLALMLIAAVSIPVLPAARHGDLGAIARIGGFGVLILGLVVTAATGRRSKLLQSFDESITNLPRDRRVARALLLVLLAVSLIAGYLVVLQLS